MNKHFLISRSDAIGDVILSLHVATVLKENFAGCKITWIGRTYTKPIIDAASFVDDFLNYDEWLKHDEKKRVEELKKQNASHIIHVFPRKELAKAAKSAGIPIRTGTSHRVFHWLTCNKLVNLGRKKSDLHEAQLNLRLLEPLGIKNKSLDELSANGVLLNAIATLPSSVLSLIDSSKKQIVLHPRSQGSAREWGTDNFLQLISILPQEKYQIFITGTEKEGESLRDFLNKAEGKIIDLTGKLSLAELITFISQSTGLVAASTGPLHISAALGRSALGIFPPIRPMHPGRWAPLGPRASYLCAHLSCEKCRKSPVNCSCMALITPQLVATQIQSWL